MIPIIHATLLLASIVYLLSLPSTGITEESYTIGMISVLLIVLANICVLLFQNVVGPRKRKNEKIGVFTLFLFAFLCVHFQTFTNLMVFSDYVDTFNVYDNKYVNLRTAIISLIGLESYLLGNSIYLSSSFKPINSRRRVLIRIDRAFKIRTDVLLLLSVVLFTILNGRVYLSGSYSQRMLNDMSGTMRAYSGILVELLLFCSIVFQIYSIRDNNRLSIKDYLQSYSFVFYVSVLIYLGLVFFSGDRGPIISFILSMAFGYIIITKHRFHWVSLLVFVVVGGLLVSVIGIARQNRTGGAYDFKNNDYVTTILNLNSVFPFTEELAGSNRTAIWAIESTPSVFPYRKGLFTLNHLLGIIPFSGTILNSLGININGTNHYGHSASFLDWYSQGDDVTSGVGTSTIADIYLDFGVLGIIIVLFFCGYFFSRIDSIVMSLQPGFIPLITMITCLVFFSNSVYLARSSIMPLFRSILWLYVLTVVLIKTNGTKTQRS